MRSFRDSFRTLRCRSPINSNFQQRAMYLTALGGGDWSADIIAPTPAHTRATFPPNPDSHLLEEPSSPAVVDPSSEHHPLTALAKDVAPVDSQCYRTETSEIKSTASPPGERQRVHAALGCWPRRSTSTK